MKNPLHSSWILILFLAHFSYPASGQKSATLNIKATGTGQTTGHVADLTLNNTGQAPVTINELTVFIPSDGKYQPYVATIPPSVVPPGATITIPLDGYCADVHTPPVGAGDGMTPIDEWITTTPPQVPGSTNTPNPLGIKEVPPFQPKDIPGLTSTPGFTPRPPTESPGTTSTWPGTDKPVGGTIDPVHHPETFGPTILKALDEIAKGFDQLKEDGKIITPFSGNPEKERESVIQQTFWIYMADITGERYQKPHFEKKIIEQFETSTGTPVTTLPEPEKKKLDSGVDAFWSVFVLTGTEAKVLSEKTPGTTSAPEKETKPVPSVPSGMTKAGGCTVTEKETDTGPKLDYAIAETGTKGKNEKVKEAFQKAIEEAAGIMSSKNGSDTVDVGFCTPQMPASAWSLYFPHVVAGQANATAFALDTKNPLESAWTTQPLETKADGSREVVLTHVMSADCKSTLIGINFAKVRASSGLKASLGSIEALRVVNFVGEIAIDIAIQKGKGTFKKLGEYLKDKTKDMAKDAAKEFIKEEMKRLGKEWKDKTDEEAEKSMDDLIKDIKTGDTGEEEETGEEFLNDWLAEILVEGEGIDPKEKVEGDLLDKIDSPIDWSPIKTNTYAIGEGSLDVYVDSDHGVAKAASGVRYKREGLEDAKDAEKGGGVFCDVGMASHTTSGSITLKTIGKTGSWAGATGEGIISTGHGIAIATLESFNAMYVIAICECPDQTSYKTYSSITAYSVEENMTGVWVSMFDLLMNEVVDQLDKDIQNTGNASKSLPKDTASKVQKGLEDAAKQAAQSILPCETAK